MIQCTLFTKLKRSQEEEEGKFALGRRARDAIWRHSFTSRPFEHAKSSALETDRVSKQWFNLGSFP
ncbi:hypothetical protein E2C01_057876 [Portunus trituberculatus]|uniref:Uncharacterized protein n=1 Tax=Portunus trituberculatus TaxID=210409 RepID=A0A5B7H164_PORTR|nr:hypothetical protein [Portunus trituberculatus]